MQKGEERHTVPYNALLLPDTILPDRHDTTSDQILLVHMEPPIAITARQRNMDGIEG